MGGYTLQPDTVTCTSCLLRRPRWPLAARQDTAQKPLTWTPGSRGLEGKASTVPWIICVGPQQTHLAMTSALHGLQPPRPGSLDVPRPTRAALDGRCVGGAGAGPWTWCGHAAPLLGHRCPRAWQWLAVANGPRGGRGAGRSRGAGQAQHGPSVGLGGGVHQAPLCVRPQSGNGRAAGGRVACGDENEARGGPWAGGVAGVRAHCASSPGQGCRVAAFSGRGWTPRAVGAANESGLHGRRKPGWTRVCCPCDRQGSRARQPAAEL